MGSGYTVESGVRLNEIQRSFMSKLRARLPSNIPLTVTSATRSPSQQASAMLKKYQLGGAKELLSTYAQDNLIAELLSQPKTRNAWARVIKDQIRRGRYISRHLRSDALDLRSKHYNSHTLNVVMAAARALASNVIYETKPPHIHIGGIGGLQASVARAAEAIESGVKSATSVASEATDAAAKRKKRAKRRARRLTRRTAQLERRTRRTRFGIAGAGLLLGLLGLLALRSSKRRGRA